MARREEAEAGSARTSKATTNVATRTERMQLRSTAAPPRRCARPQTAARRRSLCATLAPSGNGCRARASGGGRLPRRGGLLGSCGTANRGSTRRRHHRPPPARDRGRSGDRASRPMSCVRPPRFSGLTRYRNHRVQQHKELDLDTLADQRCAESAERLGNDDQVGPTTDRIHGGVCVFLPARRIVTRRERNWNGIVAPSPQYTHDQVPVAAVAPSAGSARTSISTSFVPTR